jgi:hypothetical protein
MALTLAENKLLEFLNEHAKGVRVMDPSTHGNSWTPEVKREFRKLYVATGLEKMKFPRLKFKRK